MKRRAIVMMLVGGVLPLGVASTAWACASLANLATDSRVVQRGQVVTVTGKGFRDPHAGSTAGFSLVTLRLKTRNGKILQDNVDVNSRGQISTTMRMPDDMPSGFIVILGTQTKPDGTAAFGTPGRIALRVAGTASQSAASPWSASGPSSTASVAGNGGLDSQPLLIGGILSLTLLAAGSVLVGRKNQTSTLGA